MSSSALTRLDQTSHAMRQCVGASRYAGSASWAFRFAQTQSKRPRMFLWPSLRAASVLLMRHSRKSENHLVEIIERHNGIAGHQQQVLSGYMVRRSSRSVSTQNAQIALPRRSKRHRLPAFYLKAAGLVDTDPDEFQITGINVLRGLAISVILNVLSAGIAGIAMIGS